jgi:hypothetical protein
VSTHRTTGKPAPEFKVVMGLLEIQKQDLERHIKAAEIFIDHRIAAKTDCPSEPVEEPPTMGDKKKAPVVVFFSSSQISLKLFTCMSDFNILKSMMYLAM